MALETLVAALLPVGLLPFEEAVRRTRPCPARPSSSSPYANGHEQARRGPDRHVGIRDRHPSESMIGTSESLIDMRRNQQ